MMTRSSKKLLMKTGFRIHLLLYQNSELNSQKENRAGIITILRSGGVSAEVWNLRFDSTTVLRYGRMTV